MGILEQFKNQINIMNIMYDKIKILSKTSPLLLCQNLGDKEHKAEIMFTDINTNEIRVLDKSIVDIINKNTFIAYINEDYIFKVINKNNGETMLEEEYINGMSSYVINPNKDSYEILTAVRPSTPLLCGPRGRRWVSRYCSPRYPTRVALQIHSCRGRPQSYRHSWPSVRLCRPPMRLYRHVRWGCS